MQARRRRANWTGRKRERVEKVEKAALNLVDQEDGEKNGLHAGQVKPSQVKQRYLYAQWQQIDISSSSLIVLHCLWTLRAELL